MGIRCLSIFFNLFVLLVLTLQSTKAANIKLIPRYPHISAFGVNPFIHRYHGNPGYFSSSLGQYNLNHLNHPVISNPGINVLNAQTYGLSSPHSNVNKRKPPPQHIQGPNLKTLPYQLGINKAGPKQYNNGLKQQYDNNMNPNMYNNGHKQSHSYTGDQNQYNNGHTEQHYNGDNNKNTNYNPNENYGNGNEYSNNQYNDGSYQQHGNNENGQEHQVKENNNYQDQGNGNPNSGYSEEYNNQYDDGSNHGYGDNKNQDNDGGNHSYENNKDDNEYTVVIHHEGKKEYDNNHYPQNQGDEYSHQNAYNPNLPHNSNPGSQGTGNTYDQNPQNYEGNKPNYNKGSPNQHTYAPNQEYVNNNPHNNNNNNYINKYTVNPNNGDKKPVYHDSPRPSHYNGNNNKKNAYNANYGNNNHKYNNPPKNGNEKMYQNPNGQGYAHNGQGDSNSPPHHGQVSYNDGQGHNAPPYGIQSPYSQNHGKAKTRAHPKVNKGQTNGKLQSLILNNGNGHNILKTNPQYVLNANNGQSLSALNIPPSLSAGYLTPEFLNQRIFLHQPAVFLS